MKILVIDDSSDFRNLLRMLLTEAIPGVEVGKTRPLLSDHGSDFSLLLMSALGRKRTLAPGLAERPLSGVKRTLKTDNTALC